MTIYTLGEAVLKEKAEPVSEVNDEIRALADEMFRAMLLHNGAGLAGPQVGKKLRLFVAIADDEVRRVFINPHIIETSNELCDYEEGCLSIPGVYETIRRPMRVKVSAQNENGKHFTMEADGLLARIIQHEMDHLDGILFIERGDAAFEKKTKAQFAKKREKILKKIAVREAKRKKADAKKFEKKFDAETSENANAENAGKAKASNAEAAGIAE